MADEKNTVHTEYTATANMKSAAAELAEFSRKFNSELGTMQKMVDAVDASTMKAVRNYNKMVSSFKQAQNNLQGQGALPQMGGARSKSDIAGEMSTRVGEIDKYRRQVTRALAGTVLDIEAEIKRLQEVFDQLNNNKRKNAELINKTSREIKNLRERADVIKSGPGVSAELTAARSNRAKAQLKQAAADDRFSTKAANELAAAKMRLIAVEDLLNSKGLQKKNRTTALTQEQAKLKELIKSYEDISAVVQKYNQNFTKTLGKELSSKNRQTVSDAKQVLELEQRTALIQDQISKKKAGEIRLDAAAITSLQTELKFSQQLLDLHSKDADIMARAAVLRERMATKQLQIANQVMMAEAEAANREFDRIRAHTRAAQVMMRREADLENREVTRVSRVAQARRELVQAEKNSAQDFMRASAEAENQEISRVRRVATARANAQRAEAEAANREYDLVKRTADLRARRNDPGVAANNFLKNEEAKLKIEAQILRLKQTGTAEDRVQINLLDQELIRLRQEADQLSKIHGIEARISSERAKRTQDARGETKSRLQNIRQNPGELMGIQAELMGNYAAFGAIQGAAQNMVTYVIQGETALAKFQAIAAASNVETAVMAQTMEQLGTNSKYTNLEIIDTATLLAQAGLSARDAGPALKSVAELATAAGTELKQAADVVTSVSNIWGYSTSEMGNVADILTAALNKTKLGMDQMQLGIQYAGNVAVDAGVDFVELTAAMGALAQAGIRSGSTIGTGLRALLVDLQNPNEKAVATMERLGISMEDVNLRTLGLTQVLHNLKAAGFTSADAMGAFEIRAAASFAAISNNLGVLDSLQEDLYGTNAAAAASAIQMNTVSAKWTSFVNVAQSVAKDGFAPVIAAVKVFLDVGADLLKVLNQFPNVTAAVTTGLITLFGALAVTRLAMATVAIAGMITTFGGLGVAATGAAGAVTILGISFTAIPIIGWISGIAAVAAGIWAWTKSMGEAKDTADELKGEINDISSRMQTNRQVTQALDGAVVKLNRQFGVLTEDSKMRDRTLAQTRMRFESLGLEVNKSTQSVEGMIQALEGLKDSLNQEFGAQLFALAAKMRLEADELEKRNLERGGVSDTAREAARDALKNYRNVAGPDATRGMGGAVTRAADIIENRTPLTESIRGQTVRDIQSLTTASGTIQGRIDRSTDPDQKARDQARLGLISNLIVGLGEALAALNQVVTARTNALSEADNAAYRTAMGDETTSAYNFSRSVPLNIRTKYAARVQGVTSSTASSAEKVRQADIIEADARTSGLELRERAQVVARTLPAAVRDTFLEEMTTLIDTTVNEMIITKFALIRERAENEAKTSDALANTTADRDAGQAVRSDLANLEQEQIELARDRAQQDRLSARNEEEWFLAEGRYRAAMTELRRRSVEQAEASLQNESYYDQDSTHIRPHDGPTTSVRGMRPHPVTGVRSMHDGIDIDGESGDSIRAAASGIARVKSDPRGYGNYIEVTNDDGTKSLYAHLRKVNVANEGRVERGQVIGEMGGGANDPGRGSSTGSHLHYEVRNADGVLINPEGYRGTPGGGSQGRADFDRLRQLRISNAAAEADNQQMADDRAATAVLRDLKFKPERTRMLGETRTNNARIKALIDGLRDGGDETAVLDTVVSEVRALVQQNFINAAKLIADDPKNSERVGTEGYEDEIVSAQIQVMLKGADDLDKAYESYREVQNRITEESLAFVNRELAVAGATAGTSETTVFMLEQRQQLEEYLAAQRELLANQVIYTDSVVALALAEQELANATLAVVAAQDEAALSQARIRLATATEGLGAAKQSKNAAQVQMGVSQLNVNATKPLVPLAPGAATATAAGRDWMTDPKSALDDVIAKFKNASGIMAGMSQTISQGIQGSFDALTQGINDSIMQLGDGTLTIQGLFSNLLGGILKEMQQTAAKIATNWIMQWIVRTVMGSMMPSAPGFNMDAQGMSMLNRKHGGMTPGTPKRFALGGGTGQAGRDSVHGLLEPGEITMRKSAVDFIGKDKLLEMNALGNRRLSEATSKVPMMTPREPDQVNVWLATPGQVPPPSKKDIVLMVGESMTNGELKRLVKQVAVGG